MDIQINITEEELKKQIEDSFNKTIREVVDEMFAHTFDDRYYSLLEQVTDRAVKEMPKFFEHKKSLIVDRTAEKLAKGLKISNTEIITALLALSEREGE